MQSGRVLRRQVVPSPTVLIGKDTRVSGYMIESALEAGFASAGVDVLLTGPLPTPGCRLPHASAARRPRRGDQRVAQFVRRQRRQVLLCVGREAAPTSGRWMSRPRCPSPPSGSDSAVTGQGAPPGPTRRAVISSSARAPSPRNCRSKASRSSSTARTGRATSVAPSVFHELGAEVVAIGCEPNGFNINDHVGATAPQALVACGGRSMAPTMAIALDGDADRLQHGGRHRGDATTATSCSTPWLPTGWHAGRRSPASSGR